MQVNINNHIFTIKKIFDDSLFYNMMKYPECNLYDNNNNIIIYDNPVEFENMLKYMETGKNLTHEIINKLDYYGINYKKLFTFKIPTTQNKLNTRNIRKFMKCLEYIKQYNKEKLCNYILFISNFIKIQANYNNYLEIRSDNEYEMYALEDICDLSLPKNFLLKLYTYECYYVLRNILNLDEIVTPYNQEDYYDKIRKNMYELNYKQPENIMSNIYSEPIMFFEKNTFDEVRGYIYKEKKINVWKNIYLVWFHVVINMKININLIKWIIIKVNYMN